MMRRNEFKKMIRKMDRDAMRKELDNLHLELAQFRARSRIESGSMGKDVGRIAKARYRIAVIKSIAKERGIRL